MNKLEVVLLSHFVKLADNRYRVATVLATVVSVKIPSVNAKSIAPYDYTLAFWAVCIFQRMTWNVSNVCVLQALLFCQFIVFFKCFNRCVVKIHHLVVRVEAQKMYWSIRPKLIMHESAKLSCCYQVVAHLWHYKVCDLDVDLCLVSNFFECLEDRVGTWYAYVASDKLLLAASLKVDCDAVKELTHHIDRFRSIIAI